MKKKNTVTTCTLNFSRFLLRLYKLYEDEKCQKELHLHVNSMLLCFTVLHHIKFKEFHVDWNAADRVFLFSEAKSSRLYRAVGQRLGLSKSKFARNL